MIIIHYSTALKGLAHHVEAYNREAPPSQTLKASMVHTAQAIIKIYGQALIKAQSVTTATKEDLPPLKTNNVQLAKLTHASPRTVQRHIGRLLKSKVLLAKKFHGSNSGYELWINPKIVLATEKLDVKSAKLALERSLQEARQKAANQGVNWSGATKCPHTDTGNKGYKSNNTIIGVDNSKASTPDDLPSPTEQGQASERCSAHERNDLIDPGNDTGNLTGNTGKKVNVADKAGKKVPKTRAETKRDKEAARAAEARGTSLAFYVEMLWILARNVLYGQVYLTEKQQQCAIQQLYRWYEPVATERLSTVHQIYVERIGLVRKYLDKDPEKRYVQLPNRYFDPYNPSGFAGTKAWYKLEKARQKDLQAKLILHAQIRRYLNNARKPAHRQQPALDLFRSCEQRIGKLHDPQLLAQFHAAVLKPDSYQHLYVPN